MAKDTVFSPVNYQLGELYVTVFGEDKTTGIVSLYTIALTPDEGMSFMLGTVLTNARDKQMTYQQGGDRASYIFQNAVTNEKTVSLTFMDDAVYWKDTVVARVDRNLITAMLMGDSFKADDGHIIKVIGTNGTRMVSPVETNAEPYNLFGRLGMSAKPQSDDGTGKPILVPNKDNNSFKIFGITVMIEALTTYDSQTKKGERLIFSAPKSATKVDGQPNKITVEFDVFSDTMVTDKLFKDGITSADTVSTTTADTIYAVSADYVISSSANTAPTFTGAADEVAISIDTDDGKIGIYKHDGTNWTTPVTSKLGAGAMIYGATSGTDLATKPTTGKCYVGVKTAGATTVAVASKTKTTTGSGTEGYVIKIKEFEPALGTWVTL
jgi:hypothetical protein